MEFQKYHKIDSIFKRAQLEDGSYSKFVLEGDYSKPEFQFLADKPWRWYEKIDGTNIRLIYEGDTGSMIVKGKKDKSVVPQHLLEYLENLFFPLEEKMKEMFGEKTVILFGEGYGYKIQETAGSRYVFKDKSEKNKFVEKVRKGEAKESDKVRFIGFDVSINGKYVSKEAMYEIYMELGIDTVPQVFIGTIQDAVNHAKMGFRSLIAEDDMIAEGLVGVPLVELYSRTGERVITKIKHIDFRPEERKVTESILVDKSEVYYRVEWPEAQKYLDNDDVYYTTDGSYFVPSKYIE